LRWDYFPRRAHDIQRCIVLFHVTIGHEAEDCPGRRPTELTGLVAPSDTREQLAAQLKVKSHFILWGAACMLWAQPEHLAFAILEAEDVDAVLEYVGALVPPSWTYKVRPVWNLPSQLRLLRQVRVAPTMLAGDLLSQPLDAASAPVESTVGPAADSAAKSTADSASEPSAEAGAPGAALSKTPRAETPESEPSTPASSVDEDARTLPPISVSFPPGTSTEGEEAADRAPVAEVGDSGDPAARRTWPPTEPEAGGPGTITRLLEELETPADEPEHAESAAGAEPSRAASPPSTEQATHIEHFVPPPPPRVRAWLVATNGPAQGSSYQVPLEGATVGRLPENTIYIPDERLSREHARIDFRDGKFVLSDLGSRNGTAVNGSLLTAPQQLNNGDTIELGSNTLVINIQS
jgi:hypothetical protein